MASHYYKPCPQLDRCNELIEKYFLKEDYVPCFIGHLELAEQGYPLAECQVGYFYFDGLGVEKDMEKAIYWTRRGAEHGDRDAQFNLGWFYEEGLGLERNTSMALFWYKQAAVQAHEEANEKIQALEAEL